jgi:hypothetical protein
VAQLAFSTNGPVLPAPVPSSSGTPMATACSEAAGGLFASPLSAMRCYTEGMVRERTRRGALLGGGEKGSSPEGLVPRRRERAVGERRRQAGEEVGSTDEVAGE